MAKHPKRISLTNRLHGLAWSTPWRKTVTATFASIGIIAGSIVSVDKAWPVVKPVTPVLHYQFQLAQAENKQSLDYLLLNEERRALAAAKAEQQRDPNSIIIQGAIDAYQRSIAVREKRLQGGQ